MQQGYAVGDAVLAAVSVGYGQGVGRQVRGVHLGGRQVDGYGYGDCAAAGADVGDRYVSVAAVIGEFQRFLN